MRKPYLILAAAALLLATFASGFAVAQTAPHPDFVNSWTEAVQRGLIQGDPAYYYNGDATQEEINHALLVALLSIDDQTYQQPADAPAEAYCSGTDTVAIDQYPTNGYYYIYSVNLPAHYTRAIGLTGGEVQFIEEYPAPGNYGPAERIIVCYNEGTTATTTATTPSTTATTTTTLTETTTTQGTVTTTITPTTTTSTTTTTTTGNPSLTTLYLGPEDSGKIFDGLNISNPDGDCIVIEGADDITIKNSTIGPCVGALGTDNGKAIYALNSTRIYIFDNSFVGAGRNAVQFDKVDGGDIRGNTVDYPQGTTNAEDLINLFASHNIVVDSNILTGGGPSDSGSCIMLGDGDGTNQLVTNNICIDPGQVGIGVAGGINIRVEGNTVESASYPWSNVGGYIWNQYGYCANISFDPALNNIVWFNSAGVRNDFWNGGGCS